MSCVWRYLPFRGTFGQAALLISAALLIAQCIGFFLLVNERDRLRLLDAVQPAIQTFVAKTDEVDHLPKDKQAQEALTASRPDMRFAIAPQSAIARFGSLREPDLEKRLIEAFAGVGQQGMAIQATSTGFAGSPTNNKPIPLMPPFAERIPSRSFSPGFDNFRPPPNHQELDFAVRLENHQWLNAQFLFLRPPSFFVWRLATAELVLFAVVLSVTLLLAARLTRPMTELAKASEHLAPGQAPPQVRERGPQDIRAAIRSFNAMTRRVSELLREKDRMLGAIGHDLRTPLAALRVRAEGVEPKSERDKIIATLDDMTHMVESILDLARLGHTGEEFRAVDIAALADAVAEEYRELGRDVTFTDAPKTVLQVQPMYLRRLLRNLIDNALKFGQRADVSIESVGGGTILAVSDDGPGIPPEDLARVLEPFTRLEGSRSKDTGGIGIGLSIAQNFAKSQGAELLLENSAAGGLRASVIWTNTVASSGPSGPDTN